MSVALPGAPDRMFGGYVFDLDGTIYLGDRLLPGAADALARIRRSGSRAVFLTNNPTSLPADYAAKLTRLGIPVEPPEIVSSSDALLGYLGRNAAGTRILAVAEPLLVGLLRDNGFEVTDEPHEADVVVVSFDRTFDYAKFTAAYKAVRNGARIVATNPDPYCPTPDGGIPDCGAILAAIEVATGAVAEAIVGKPSEHMATTVVERLGLSAGDTLLVGDRLLTDVRMARRAGMHAALVLTGATTSEDLAASEDTPDYVISDLTQLIPAAV